MTLLIRDVQILGGARAFPEPVDLFVSGEKISAIGHFPNKPADAVLDGQGAYLSPGFIDVNTDSDHYLSLFEHPSQEDFLRQGVTTIFGGMCGASLAPLLYGGLESLRKWTDPNRINVSWHTLSEFLKELDRHPLGVNFGTLAGHATIRRAILGDAERDLTKNELGVLAETLEHALEDGAFGFSTGLAYLHARKAGYAELKILADLTKRFNGIYATHLRDAGEGISDAVQETKKLADDSRVKTLISHFVPLLGTEKKYASALAAINATPAAKNFRFDIYASSSTLHPIYTFLPQWAQAGGASVMLANVRDEWYVRRMKNDMPLLDENNFVVAEAPDADFLVGKSLAEIKEMYELKDSRDALLKLMAVMQMRGGALYKEVATDLSRRAMKSAHSFIASNAPSFSEYTTVGRRLKSERSTRTFTDFLGLVQNEKLLSLEKAVSKLTSEPARFFGLPQRGMIVEGYIADLTCFKGNEIKFTIVNGRVAVEAGEFKNILAGKALRRHG